MDTLEIVDRFSKAGFKYSSDLIHVFLGGSSQHGASIPGKVSDIDLFGIYIEPPPLALGINEESHFTGGTSDQYERNRPGDEDYKAYTLTRWASLAARGNPTILGFLYTPCLTAGVWHDLILPNKHLFKAKSHAKAFLGYAKGQWARLNGDAGSGKHGQRSELIEKWGYDCKAGMHLMRLLFEAEEYMNLGKITYPRPEKELLLSIRQGAWTRDKLYKEYTDAEMRVEEAMRKSSLPESVDRNTISELVASCYLTHWARF
jgi:uncharacterized protein